MSEKLISEKWLRDCLDDYDTKFLEPAALQMLNNFYAALIEAPAVDAVEVTYCDQCSNHGHCIPEDTFRLAGVEKPFCCVGGRREEIDKTN